MTAIRFDYTPRGGTAIVSVLESITTAIGWSGSDDAEHWVEERPSVRATFESLARDWRAQTGDISSAREIVLNDAYQKIVGLGWAAVPLILEELTVRPALWFHALSAITRTNPVPSAHRGNVVEMAADWLRWGRERRLIV